MDHDGSSYSFTVPNLEVLECAGCGNRTLPDASFARVIAQLRMEAELLTPEDIRAGRKRLSMTQEQLAALLKVAKETVSRWETGAQIQQAAMNSYLKAFFALPELRDWLREERAGTARQQPIQATAGVEVNQSFDAGAGWAASGESGVRNIVGVRTS
jgi:DNA-binding transcriptional regulator YiaG